MPNAICTSQGALRHSPCPQGAYILMKERHISTLHIFIGHLLEIMETVRVTESLSRMEKEKSSTELAP